MKLALLATMFLAFLPLKEWKTDFRQAQQEALKNNKHILLNFSGSDWCGPCIRLKKEVFDSDEFDTLADQSLVLVNADFPRNKKNQLNKEQQQQNDALAEKYNPLGKFPYTVLLKADGSVVKSWEGFPEQGVKSFINEIRNTCQ